MDESTERFFGFAIAYILPGFVSLWGASQLSPTLANWLSADAQSNPALGGVLYAILASLAAGLTLSAVRWALIDTLHHHTGVPFPNPDFSQMQEKLDGYRLAIEHYYRYYQFYANTFIAIGVAEGCRIWSGHRPQAAEVILVTAVEAIHLVTSRDCLNRYYTRVGQLLGTLPASRRRKGEE
jgi:hypothetical protein